MEQSEKFNKLNKDIVREIIVCMKTYGTEQEITKPPYKIQKGIRAKNLWLKLDANRKKYQKKSFSLATFYDFIEVLVENEFVKQHDESHKCVIYELDEIKWQKWEKAFQVADISTDTIKELVYLLNALHSYLLNSYLDKPAFGLVGIEREEKIRKLVYIRDTCRKIASQIDFLGLP